ncbi:MAG: hypothetical protein IPJ84_04900 [Bdellovibrionales bacterium]|nr:hypothetical protein [Bdellovibrionales bacterium]
MFRALMVQKDAVGEPVVTSHFLLHLISDGFFFLKMMNRAVCLSGIDATKELLVASRLHAQDKVDISFVEKL